MNYLEFSSLLRQNMDPKSQAKSKTVLIEELIRDLELLYISKFDKLAQMNGKEAFIAKVSQLFLLSRESAIHPLRKELGR